MEIVFATNNPHKLKEIGTLVGDRFRIHGLWELGISEEIPEEYETLEQNASQKAWHVCKLTGKNCFADDTGLEVKALQGAPGAYSARYSRIGHPVFPEMEVAMGNIHKLLLEMEGVQDRSARFRTVISLVMEGKEYMFEGVADGDITYFPSGGEGFGYDPVFRPKGHEKTFAEMALMEKNRISHRAKAVQKLAKFLSGI
jgi:XTP/dITP diphosphohydrolase